MTSQEEWKKRIQEYKNSGMSQASRCRSQGISKSTFQYHLAKSITTKFIELKTPSKGIKIRRRQISFEIDPDFDVITLSRFLQALR